MWFQLLQVWFAPMFHPLENTWAHQSLNWPHTLVSLKLLILFQVSAGPVCTFPSFNVYLLLIEHFPFHIFQGKNESRDSALSKKKVQNYEYKILSYHQGESE